MLPTLAVLSLGAIVEGSILPESVEAPIVVPWGVEVKFIGKRLKTNLVPNPILNVVPVTICPHLKKEGVELRRLTTTYGTCSADD